MIEVPRKEKIIVIRLHSFLTELKSDLKKELDKTNRKLYSHESFKKHDNVNKTIKSITGFGFTSISKNLQNSKETERMYLMISEYYYSYASICICKQLSI